jgi:hypothetical protein
MQDKSTLTRKEVSVISSNGNVSFMVLYEYDGNAIMAEPIKNNKAGELLRSFQFMEQKLTSRGLKPKPINHQDINFQLVPSYCDQSNAV